MKREAIGLVETISIAMGVRVTDEMAKTADIEVLESTAICPGKYMVLIAGDVSSVESALAKGELAGGNTVVDTLFIPHVHPQVFPAILGATEVAELRALGVLETFTVASTILAADAAAKAAPVELLEIRLAKGLGGKAFFTMTGEVYEIEAAMDAGLEMAKKSGNLVRSVVIPRPHNDLGTFLL
ncbi:MAG: BMC domain-containing protein [Candidatus Eisenbacteria bacterium]|nr:BMC domain-containing protein [Candidatus Eisenbacteria bacterium]